MDVWKYLYFFQMGRGSGGGAVDEAELSAFLESVQPVLTVVGGLLTIVGFLMVAYYASGASAGNAVRGPAIAMTAFVIGLGMIVASTLMGLV